MKKPYTVMIKNVGNWWTAVCKELMVSGFGKSKKAALVSVAVSMRSTLGLYSKILGTDYRKLTRVRNA